MTAVREFRGVIIHENPAPCGYKLRWWAFSPRGGQLAADTLAGMRELIRRELER